MKPNCFFWLHPQTKKCPVAFFYNVYWDQNFDFNVLHVMLCSSANVLFEHQLTAKCLALAIPIKNFPRCKNMYSRHPKKRSFSMSGWCSEWRSEQHMLVQNDQSSTWKCPGWTLCGIGILVQTLLRNVEMKLFGFWLFDIDRVPLRNDLLFW